ncbi:hypothetical protein [Denitrobaculum tricleocarpae]|uniref:Lipoprotein n=1 Tax=Denitrobaculum tricleocarpae TaxID=2591009 RepID=A0A545T7R6_9PROT|nr:hypothetical protein [Denitrobaculum tricleocarpae]TQV73276.1 hypothetical protein FKG95_24975 [Denitrobaculum tricleocarpae]
MRGLKTLGAIALGVLLAGCGDDNAKPEGFPESRVRNDIYGAIYKRPAVTTENRDVSYWAQDLALDYSAPRLSDAPAQLVKARKSAGCSLPKPSADAEVVYVEIYSGRDDAPLFLVTPKDVEGVKRYIEAKNKRPDLDRLLSSGNARQVDVFVTEVEKPVYLVLAAYDTTIWSLQLAEGVKLDGVAVIAYEAQALAHAPKQARVSYIVHEDSPQSRCMTVPHRPVNENWKAVERAAKQNHDRGFNKILKDARRDHRKFRSWMLGRVGPPDRNIDAYQTAHVLIGPKPATPLRYKPLTGSALAYSANAIAIWGDESDAAAVIYDLAEKGK